MILLCLCGGGWIFLCTCGGRRWLSLSFVSCAERRGRKHIKRKSEMVAIVRSSIGTTVGGEDPSITPWCTLTKRVRKKGFWIYNATLEGVSREQ